MASITSIEIGAEVEILGLKSMPQLNGTRGTVCAWASDTGRFQVLCAADGQTRALKPTNLAEMDSFEGGGTAGAPRSGGAAAPPQAHAGARGAAAEKAATKRRLSLAGKAMLGEATESTGGGGGGGEAPLPRGWTRAHDIQHGRDYYCNRQTGETRWDPPSDFSAVSAAAAAAASESGGGDGGGGGGAGAAPKKVVLGLNEVFRKAAEAEQLRPSSDGKATSHEAQDKYRARMERQKGEADAAHEAEIKRRYRTQGWMAKKGVARRNWTRRWFILDITSGELRYYQRKDAPGAKPALSLKGVILLEDAALAMAPKPSSGSRYEHMIHLTAPKHHHGVAKLAAEHAARTFCLRAESGEEMVQWMESLDVGIVEATVRAKAEREAAERKAAADEAALDQLLLSGVRHHAPGAAAGARVRAASRAHE
jgi:hypothetical protein